MPELPEVECVRRSLEPWLLGRRITQVVLRRSDIVTFADDNTTAGRRRPSRRSSATLSALLLDCVITEVCRHGKQLAIAGEDASRSRAMVVHLGMTGRLVRAADLKAASVPHTHAAWKLDSGDWLMFRDPRRFGGIWPVPSPEALRSRWAALGPDALTLKPRDLAESLESSARPIKSALLDQAIIAGIGNIYADEILFATGIHPLTSAGSLTKEQLERVATETRRILRAAIKAGGSTLRDYVDAEGRPGTYAIAHAAYGRGGEKCTRCTSILVSEQVAQRTTTWCPKCQPAPNGVHVVVGRKAAVQPPPRGMSRG